MNLYNNFKQNNRRTWSQKWNLCFIRILQWHLSFAHILYMCRSLIPTAGKLRQIRGLDFWKVPCILANMKRGFESMPGACQFRPITTEWALIVAGKTLNLLVSLTVCWLKLEKKKLMLGFTKKCRADLSLGLEELANQIWADQF